MDCTAIFVDKSYLSTNHYISMNFCCRLRLIHSFNPLESLNIRRMKPDLLNSFLIHLADLPCLFSLIIKTWNDFENLNEVYRLIFPLSKLKYNKFELCGHDSSITLPMATKKQLSNIQHLDILDANVSF
jgi:hypothetical protein